MSSQQGQQIWLAPTIFLYFNHILFKLGSNQMLRHGYFLLLESWVLGLVQMMGAIFKLMHTV